VDLPIKQSPPPHPPQDGALVEIAPSWGFDQTYFLSTRPNSI
jgi:hypothetical protein